jgi:uncharacterized protein (DUF2126 family)
MVTHSTIPARKRPNDTPLKRLPVLLKSVATSDQQKKANLSSLSTGTPKRFDFHCSKTVQIIKKGWLIPQING